jgi:hypothetical protein
MNEIYIIHKNWEGLCILDKDKIYRKEYINDEFGTYIKNENKLKIIWEKWDEEFFFNFYDDNLFYLKEIYEQKYELYFFCEKENIFNTMIDNYNKKLLFYENKIKIINEYKISDDIICLLINNKLKKYKKYINNIYILIPNQNFFFDLEIINDNIIEKYIFNKYSKYFFSINNIENNGKYQIIDNNILMVWENGFKKQFTSNKYLSNDKIDKNIIFIKPKNVIINNKVLFSNISLSKKNIILTSLHYKENNWNLDDINIDVKNNKIISKNIFDNDHYESSLTIIIELEKIVNNIYIIIKYLDTHIFEIFLEQLKIVNHNISAMTLIKDDIFLLKRYFKYYHNLGIEVFFIYYNKKIDHLLIHKLND